MRHGFWKKRGRPASRFLGQLTQSAAHVLAFSAPHHPALPFAVFGAWEILIHLTNQTAYSNTRLGCDHKVSLIPQSLSSPRGSCCLHKAACRCTKGGRCSHEIHTRFVTLLSLNTDGQTDPGYSSETVCWTMHSERKCSSRPTLHALA